MDGGQSTTRSRRAELVRVAPAALLAVIAAACWVLALPDVDVTRLDGRGLLACLPPLWFAALAAAVLAPCLLLGVRVPGRTGRTPVMVAALGVLVAVLYGTTAAVYPEPRFYATYKHVAVVDYFLSGNPIDRAIDIYQSWPGFFLLTAGVHAVTGVPVLVLARWSEPFFAAVVALAVAWTTGGLAPRRGRAATAAEAVRWWQVRWGAALLVTVANWVGQNYFSPQALAFPLSLAVIGMLLRMVPAPAGEQLRWRVTGWRLHRAVPAAGAPADAAPADAVPADAVPAGGAVPGPGFWGGRAGACVCLATYAAIVVSHQLSPVIVLGQAIALAVVFRMRNAWLPLAFAAVEAAWMVQAWGFVSEHFSVVQVKGVENVRPPSVRPAESLPWAQTLAWASPAIMALLGLLTLVAVLGLVRHLSDRPDRRWVLAPVLFGLVPVAVILVQPYGNEGIFRAFLFALPWSAVLVARGLLVHPVRWRPGRGWLRYAVPLLLAGLWLPTSFGLELDNYVHPSDVRTAQWASANTPPTAGYLRVTAGTPLPLTGDYPAHRSTWELLNQPLTVWPDYPAAAAAGPEALAEFVAASASWYLVPDVYLFLGPGQAAHVRYYGDLGPTRWPDLEAAIAAGGRFELVHRDGGSSVWHYLGTTAASAASTSSRT